MADWVERGAAAGVVVGVGAAVAAGVCTDIGAGTAVAAGVCTDIGVGAAVAVGVGEGAGVGEAAEADGAGDAEGTGPVFDVQPHNRQSARARAQILQILCLICNPS